MRIDHFAVGVEDLDPAVAWYRDVIGLREVSGGNGRRFLGCGGRPDFDLALEEGAPGLRHVAYGTFDPAEHAEACARLDASGLAAADPCQGPGIEAAQAVRLPGGHELQVVLRQGADCYPSVAQWSPQALHSPREIDHVNIATRDVDATIDALKTALDLRLSDVHRVEGHGNVGGWMRATDRHHDFAILRSRGEGLHHIAYQVADAGSLIAFADRLNAAGTRAEFGVGRHSPGSNLFLYVRDPSGNRVELTADMAMVPPGAPHRTWHGTDPGIMNSLAPYGPPKAFWEIT